MIVDTTSFDLGAVQMQHANADCTRELQDLELDAVDGGLLGVILGGAVGAGILYGIGYLIGKYSK